MLSRALGGAGTRRSFVERRVLAAGPRSGAVVPLLAAAIVVVLLAGAAAALQTPRRMAQAAAPAFVGAEPTAPAAAPAAPADPPVKLDVAQVGIATSIEPLGLNPDRTLQVPADYAKAGWFTGLEAPGEVGTAVVAGHYDSETGPAVFFRLHELGPGSEVVVTLASGVRKTFVVERVARYPKKSLPTIEVYGPSDRAALRLVTCGGEFDKRRRSYRDNVVVYAYEREST